MVQDVSSMLVAEIANPSKGDYVIDLCAAPGGKSLHMGDKMEGFGTVDARDVSQYKVDLIEENIHRAGAINVQAKVKDATVFDVDSECQADIVLADVPCSGYGVIGKSRRLNTVLLRRNRKNWLFSSAIFWIKPLNMLSREAYLFQYLYHCKRGK